MIDISGSMKARTEDHLRFAHANTHGSVPVATYLIGARLTPLTTILKRKKLAAALTAASIYVNDWDGGTRIGSALGQLLASPRRANQLRGALVLVLSDGLERGDHHEMVAACQHIAALAYCFAWLTSYFQREILSDRRPTF
ncbi:MAG: VWA domain-containing protein [Alphaproteobacteria bacterium]